jgi:glycosyltransferase involved in cell wall biosynthesis
VLAGADGGSIGQGVLYMAQPWIYKAAKGTDAHLPGWTTLTIGNDVKISVVTAVWNREKTIADAIDSVQAQSHQEIEHLIIDGASTDNSLSIIESRKDGRTIVFSEPDNGIYDALNKGIALATGEIIGLMHSDDFFARDDVLAKVAAAFEATDVMAVYGDLDYVAADNPEAIIRHWKSEPFTPARLRRGWMPPHPTLYLRRSVFEKYGLYDTSYRIAADYDAVLRYFSQGDMKSVYIPDVLVKMRVGGESNRSLSKILAKSREDYRALRSNDLGGIYALMAKNLSKLPQFLRRKM